MKLHQATAQRQPIVVSDTPEGLAAIYEADCAAALWQRKPLASFQSWIDALNPDQLPRIRMMLKTDSVQEAVTQVCDSCATPCCYERALLIDDIAATAHIFSDLMNAPYISLHLDVVSSVSSPNFHLDAVTARLICTYRGTGTQYARCTNGESPQHIFTVPTGTPVVLRGSLWPVRTNSRLLHRSPPTKDKGETRLVLSLDTVPEPGQHQSQFLVH